MSASTDARRVLVAALTAVPEGEARGFEVEGREIILCREGGEIYALEGMCTHQGLPIDGGEIRGGEVTCEWHGARFDVCSGRATGLPAVRGLQTYETSVEGGRVSVEVPA